jgi:hypothetical protein
MAVKYICIGMSSRKRRHSMERKGILIADVIYQTLTICIAAFDVHHGPNSPK